MAEQTIHITRCDVCGKKETKSYTELLHDNDWTTIKIKNEWANGAHRGYNDLNIMVCNKCRYKSSTYHLLMYHMKKLINK